MNRLSGILLAMAGMIAVLHGMVPHNHAKDSDEVGIMSISATDDATDFFRLNAGAEHLENLLPRLSGPELPEGFLLFPVSFALFILSLSFFLSYKVRQTAREHEVAEVFAGYVPRTILRPPPVL